MNWRIVWAIARKDIVDAIKNMYILFALVLPVGMSLLLGVVFPSEQEILTMTVAVYDPGGSRLVSVLRELPETQVRDVASAEELAEVVRKDATGGLIVPAGFDAAVSAGQQPDLTVYLNRRRGGGELAVFQRMVEQQVWAMVGQSYPVKISWMDVENPAGIQKPGGFQLQDYMLVIFLVMGLAMVGTFMVPTLLVEEKEKHTLDALLISPARPAEVMAGKALTGLVYCLLISGLLIVLNRGWTGNWPMTLVALVVGSLFVVAVGLLMGGLFHTTNQVNTWSSIVMLALMIPSWSGIFGNPPIVEQLFDLVPTHYMANVLQLSLAGEASLGRVWMDLAVLGGSTILVLGAVLRVLRRENR
jgi:ABC-2 type transport system permease protein